MNGPKVNIITSIYNGEKYIKRFYESLASIQYDNISFIIVNDGSTDSTNSLLTELKVIDKRIVYINKMCNEGVSKARNDALKIADGKYCFIFDCDDTFEPEIIDKCVSYAEEYQYEAVLYIVNNRTPDGKIHPFDFRYEKDSYQNKEIIEVVSKSFGISIDELKAYLMGKRQAREGKQRNGPWRMMYSLETIKKNNMGFPETLRIGEDTIFTNEYLCYCNTIGVMRENLYYAWVNNTSTIHSYHRDIRRMVQEKTKIVQEKYHMEERVLKAKGYDISSCWGGEAILSSIQLAWLLASDTTISYNEKLNLVKAYQNNSIVQNIWKKITWKNLLACTSIKAIPVLMFKLHMESVVLLLMIMIKKLKMNIKI